MASAGMRYRAIIQGVDYNHGRLPTSYICCSWTSYDKLLPAEADERALWLLQGAEAGSHNNTLTIL